MNLIEAAKQALKFFDDEYPNSPLTANLRAAIEEAEKQEPVAFANPYDLESDTHIDCWAYKTQTYRTPLYTNPAPAVPEGWQLVPKEPTDEMIDAACKAAAPKPEW